MARELRRGEITDKDMSVIREGDQTKKQRERKGGNLKDYSLHHNVSIAWDLNEEAERDRMFRFKIDEKEVILDAEELLRFLRWI